VNLAETIKQTRENRKWSQIELSRNSRVSTRTIVDIEGGKQKTPREDVLIRLAKALDLDPGNLLRLAGHSNVPKEKIERVVRESGGFRFRGEIDPGEFFESLRPRLRPNQPILISVVYPSAPGSIHRRDVQRTLVDLFGKGLWLSLACPFPRIEIEKAKRTSLARHYRDVYGQVVELARELQNELPPERRKQLAVFVPRQSGRVHYVMPLAGLTEYRPTLIKYFRKSESGEAEYELCVWTTLMQERRDRWVQIYPAPTEPEHEIRFQKLLCWKDYLSDIQNKCDAVTGKGWKAEDFTNADWELVDLEPAD